jgi:hypothetical protein
MRTLVVWNKRLKPSEPTPKILCQTSNFLTLKVSFKIFGFFYWVKLQNLITFQPLKLIYRQLVKSVAFYKALKTVCTDSNNCEVLDSNA